MADGPVKYASMPTVGRSTKGEFAQASEVIIVISCPVIPSAAMRVSIEVLSVTMSSAMAAPYSLRSCRKVVTPVSLASVVSSLANLVWSSSNGASIASFRSASINCLIVWVEPPDVIRRTSAKFAGTVTSCGLRHLSTMFFIMVRESPVRSRSSASWAPSMTSPLKPSRVRHVTPRGTPTACRSPPVKKHSSATRKPQHQLQQAHLCGSACVCPSAPLSRSEKARHPRQPKTTASIPYAGRTYMLSLPSNTLDSTRSQLSPSTSGSRASTSSVFRSESGATDSSRSVRTSWRLSVSSAAFASARALVSAEAKESAMVSSTPVSSSLRESQIRHLCPSGARLALSSIMSFSSSNVCVTYEKALSISTVSSMS
mmetsp:Transcript_129119/g.346320  ORF Transcript_129119/g.346320 Transcript_129119/m.346320 type:complete len:371 (+) Transcript_129119:861-1973(+)